MKINKMFTEYLEAPIGIDAHNIRFSWVLNSDCAEQQACFRVTVKKEDDGKVILDSGLVENDNIAYIACIGEVLESDSDYLWELVVCGDKGSQGRMQSGFRTALLDSSDWKAKWIGRRSGEVLRWDENAENISDVHIKAKEFVNVEKKSLLMRNEFKLVKGLKRAIAYVCGLGLYEFSINGEKVGDKVLTPLITDYSKRVLYDIYDITPFLDNGVNSIAIETGNGWYSSSKKYWDWRMKWYGNPRAIIQIHIEYNDREKEVIVSDEHWKISEGCVIENCLYDGEVYDARNEKKGWKLPGYNDLLWDFAKNVEPPCNKLVSNIYTPIKVNEVIKPVSVSRLSDSKLIYDFGVNISGWVRLSLQGTKGTKINIRHSEFVNDDGTLNTQSNRAALNTDTYILKGEGTEIYEPRFTFHGFRYTEITSQDDLPTVIKAEACFVYSAVEHTGLFYCDNPPINRLHDTILRTQRAALMGAPIDCPQRDERLGWLGDAHITAEVCMHNYDMALFYKKWLDDIKYQQHSLTGEVPIIAPRPDIESSADWSSAYSLVVWYFYQHYGDEGIIREHYDGLKKYVKFLKSKATGYFLSKSKYGDWLSVVSGWTRGDPEYTNTLYFYYNIINLVRMAKILGKDDDAYEYRAMADEMKAVINERYYDKAAKNFGDGTQFSNAFALILKLIPEEDERAVVGNLVERIKQNNDYHLNTGILGTKYVMDALRLYGEEETGYKLITQKSFPSWMNMIEGRTTLPETWDKGASGNHCMFGSVDTWFYKVLGGINIDPEIPGFKHVIIKPYIPSDLNHVFSKIETVRGEIVSEWNKNQNSIVFQIKIPNGSTGELWIDKRLSVKQIKYNGEASVGEGAEIKAKDSYMIILLKNGENVVEVLR